MTGINLSCNCSNFMLFSKFHHVVISDYFANSYLPCHNEQNLFSLFLPKRKRLLKAFSVLFWVIFLFIAECSSFEMLPLTFVMLILSCCLLSMLIIVKVDYCQCWVLSMLIFVNVDYCQCWLLSMLTIVKVDYCQCWLLSCWVSAVQPYKILQKRHQNIIVLCTIRMPILSALNY